MDWTINNLEHDLDGKVLTVHYSVSLQDTELNADNEPYSAGAYGSIGLEGEVTTAYEKLTPELVTGWVKAHLGDEKVAEIEQALAEQIELQKQPKVLSGVPWA